MRSDDFLLGKLVGKNILYHASGQIIATSAEFTPKGSLVGESSKNSLINSGLGIKGNNLPFVRGSFFGYGFTWPSHVPGSKLPLFPYSRG